MLTLAYKLVAGSADLPSMLPTVRQLGLQLQKYASAQGRLPFCLRLFCSQVANSLRAASISFMALENVSISTSAVRKDKTCP